jgi:hypothetical protein
MRFHLGTGRGVYYAVASTGLSCRGSSRRAANRRASASFGLIVTPSMTSSDPTRFSVCRRPPGQSGLEPIGAPSVCSNQSSGVLLRAIAALKLADDPEFNGQSVFGGFLRMFGLDAVGPDVAGAKTLNALKRRLAVRRADKVFVVEVIVTAREA